MAWPIRLWHRGELWTARRCWSNKQLPRFLFFWFAETLLRFDHQENEGLLHASLFAQDESIKRNWRAYNRHSGLRSNQSLTITEVAPLDNVDAVPSVSDEDFCQTVRDLKNTSLKAMYSKWIPSSLRYLACSTGDTKNSKQSNQSPYMFYMQDGWLPPVWCFSESALKYETETNQIRYPVQVLVVAVNAQQTVKSIST